jgi:hypothetical protein
VLIANVIGGERMPEVIVIGVCDRSVDDLTDPLWGEDGNYTRPHSAIKLPTNESVFTDNEKENKESGTCTFHKFSKNHNLNENSAFVEIQDDKNHISSLGVILSNRPPDTCVHHGIRRMGTDNIHRVDSVSTGCAMA